MATTTNSLSAHDRGLGKQENKEKQRIKKSGKRAEE